MDPAADYTLRRKTANIMILTFVIVSAHHAQQTSVLVVHPILPQNNMATGYEGLELTAHIPKDNYEVCNWL